MNSDGAYPPGVTDDDPHFNMPTPEESDEVLEEALKKDAERPEPHSTPPAGLQQRPCSKHGSPAATLTTKVDDDGNPVGTWIVFEDGCEEPFG